MSNIHDRHEKPLDGSLHAKAGRNAALRGALLAFAKPPLTQQHSHTTTLQPTAPNGGPSTSRQPKSGFVRQPLPVGVSSHHQINHADPPDQDDVDGRTSLFDYADIKPNASGFLTPGIYVHPRSKSPSSIAAGLAALRHSSHVPERSPSLFRGNTRQQISAPDELSKQRLSPVHTAGQVRQWLDHVDGSFTRQDTNSERPIQRAATGPSMYSGFHDTTTPAFPLSPLRAEEHSDYFALNHPAEVRSSYLESPRPIRASSTAASLESAALMSSSEPSMFDNQHGTTEYRHEYSNMPPSHTGQTSSDFSESEVTGTADEEDLNDLNSEAERDMGMQQSYDPLHAESSSGVTTQPIAIPTTKPRPPPSLRPVMDARRKLDNAKRGIQPIMSGWKPSSAHHVDSLASAMIASSLAASRAPSPTKSPAPPLTRRHTDHSHSQKSHLNIGRRPTRSPSPPRAMPHTLRKTKSSSDEDEKDKGRIHRVKRGLHIHKHPHKHHEGDRKRWRNEMTPRECKRYEGLWAANRGLHIELEPGTTFDPLNSHVSNMVVKDIWMRSRLPLQALEEVWDLVDREGLGKLTKEEFVVGMWLVDQRLKGRKLPAKVGQSVWRSARGLYGLKVPRMKDKH